MTAPKSRWEIQFRDNRAQPRWTVSGHWPRRAARLALAQLRSEFADAEWRLLWNGLVVDPLPTRRGALPILRIAA